MSFALEFNPTILALKVSGKLVNPLEVTAINNKNAAAEEREAVQKGHGSAKQLDVFKAAERRSGPVEHKLKRCKAGEGSARGPRKNQSIYSASVRTSAETGARAGSNIAQAQVLYRIAGLGNRAQNNIRQVHTSARDEIIIDDERPE
ncbi:hypothetical protein LTR08_006129 [Meristemomyces frigidus]|nr:hypothetical protein LTR08_006129 [Meristemomyces frigidus]